MRRRFAAFLTEQERFPEVHLLVQYWVTLRAIRYGPDFTREDFLQLSSAFSCYYLSTIAPY
jgi:hypothetical protein